jgi:hypothetical protein
MQFWITIENNWEKYRYLVKYELIDERTEHFTVIARNGSLTFSSNRPLFRNKGLKKRRPDI